MNTFFFILFAYLTLVNLRILTLSGYLWVIYNRDEQVVDKDVIILKYIQWFMVDLLFDLVNWNPKARLKAINDRSKMT